MASEAVERIAAEIRTLEPAERERLRAMLDSLSDAADEQRKREAVRQSLRDAGLVTRSRQPRTRDVPGRRLIAVEGKPVSETLVEDRR